MKAVEVVQRELNEKLVRYNAIKMEVDNLERDIAELRHGIRVLGGVPVEAGGSPAPVTPVQVKRDTPPDIGEIIMVMHMGPGKNHKICRKVVADIMTIISKMPDDVKFRAGSLRPVIDKYYPDARDPQKIFVTTGYLKFLMEKKVLLYNGKRGTASAYMKAPRIRVGEPGAVDVAKMLEQERQLQRDVQGK